MQPSHDMTAEDFFWTEEPGRLDLIRGELVQQPYGGGLFGSASATVAYHVWNHDPDHQLGRGFAGGTGFILAENPDTVLTPEVAFVTKWRLPPKEERIGFVAIAPDLAVEVISPLDRDTRMTEKVLAYLEAGTRLVWVVEPVSRSITVYNPDRTARILLPDDYVQGGDVLPGFYLQVSEIFVQDW